MQGSILQSIPPDTMMIESAWMTRYINNEEVINWMKGARHTAPAEMYAALEQIAVAELPAERWATVSDQLQEPVMA